MGATTIWERWDSMLPDGSINPGEMTSFNHYALGAVADWMHRTIGGIAPLDPGYARGAGRAPSRRRHPMGPLRVGNPARLDFRLLAARTPTGSIELDVAVPDGVAALVQLPGTDGAGARQRPAPSLNLRSLNPHVTR